MTANFSRPIIVILTILICASCSVISEEMRREAGPRVEFKHLSENLEGYVGQTVILGGYILDSWNAEGTTALTVLQTPLSGLHEPGIKAHSSGRFVILHEGTLDSELYHKNRKITVAGTVVLPAGKLPEDCPAPCPAITKREVYLWQDYSELDRYWNYHHEEDYIFDRGYYRYYRRPHYHPRPRPRTAPPARPHIH